MSKKVPEVIMTGTAHQGGIYWHNLEDMVKYCHEHLGEDLFIHIEPMAQVSEKLKMFAFYHKVVLHCAVIGYTGAGYEGIDNVHADYKLRAEFAKDFIKDPKGNWEPIVLQKSGMTKARFHKFLEDCIFFIEQTLQQRIPDSQEYRMFQETGKQFKTVK